MKVHVASILPCSPELAWDRVQTSELLMEVIHPLLRFRPLPGQSFPARWREGETIVGKGHAFCFFPMGRHSLYFEKIDQTLRQIQTREKNFWVACWDHLIWVQAAANGETLYSDDIEVHAGPFTIFVWLYAQWFYRHRHKRWRRVAQRLAAGLP